jgi:hypothetical protein
MSAKEIRQQANILVPESLVRRKNYHFHRQFFLGISEKEYAILLVQNPSGPQPSRLAEPLFQKRTQRIAVTT